MTTVKIKDKKLKKNSYEIEYWSKTKLVCGIDEVGRGCFAGPVVAAAVILKPNKKHKLLKDSKTLTAEERQEAFYWLQKNSIFGLGIVNHREIDTQNLHNATLIAMKKALYNLLSIASDSYQIPEIIIIDYMPLKTNLDIPIHHFPFGESKSISIAAASIIAKVTRDNLMARMNNVFTGYSFDTNKGYRTPVHKKSIHNFGMSLIHRRRFVNDWLKKINESN